MFLLSESANVQEDPECYVPLVGKAPGSFTDQPSKNLLTFVSGTSSSVDE